jgi:hypothetical protein
MHFTTEWWQQATGRRRWRPCWQGGQVLAPFESISGREIKLPLQRRDGKGGLQAESGPKSVRAKGQAVVRANKESVRRANTQPGHNSVPFLLLPRRRAKGRTRLNRLGTRQKGSTSGTTAVTSRTDQQRGAGSLLVPVRRPPASASC